MDDMGGLVGDDSYDGRPFRFVANAPNGGVSKPLCCAVDVARHQVREQLQNLVVVGAAADVDAHAAIEEHVHLHQAGLPHQAKPSQSRK